MLPIITLALAAPVADEASSSENAAPAPESAIYEEVIDPHQAAFDAHLEQVKQDIERMQRPKTPPASASDHGILNSQNSVEEFLKTLPDNPPKPPARNTFRPYIQTAPDELRRPMLPAGEGPTKRYFWETTPSQTDWIVFGLIGAIALLFKNVRRFIALRLYIPIKAATRKYATQISASGLALIAASLTILSPSNLPETLGFLESASANGWLTFIGAVLAILGFYNKRRHPPNSKI